MLQKMREDRRTSEQIDRIKQLTLEKGFEKSCSCEELGPFEASLYLG
jgi:hypothetical protein